ncbi:hypothetical protein K6119_13015 [Paracrocinitomix mangrovi]|uniref:tetratricopeptide repeat protein n=1 Tax=Paracrocinitomix mangrovi TaxID=2862509 RepID=UPI001C8E5876|nr:tetratricopeptide repeat protein [Paracrocinitomix mangrovi]UKN00650.1 hypothetical protein K6119_13015 [Paracrocinitomix mangrovi]
MKFCLLLLAFASVSISFSQSTKSYLDSLKFELSKTEDEEQKLQLLSQIGEHLLSTKPEDALPYSEKLMSLSKQKENHRWITTAYFLQGRVLSRLGKIEEANEVYSSSIDFELNANPIDHKLLAWAEVNYGNFLKNTSRYQLAAKHFKNGYASAVIAEDASQQVDCLVNTGAMFMYLGHNDSALNYFKPAKMLAYETKDSGSLQTISNNMANLYEGLGEYDKALKELEIAEFLAEDDVDLGYVYGTKGNIYYYKGNMDSAAINLSISIDYFKSANRIIEQGQLLLALGEILVFNEDYDRAKSELKKAESIFKNAGNDSFLAAVYVNIGGLFKESGNLDSSYYYYKKSEELSKKTENWNFLGVSYQNLAVIEEEKGNYAASAELLEKSLLLYQQINDKRLIGEGQVALANAYIQLGDFTKAKNHINEGVKFAEEVGSMKLQMKAYNNYIQTFSTLNGTPEVFDYHEKYIELLDSLKSEKNSTAAEGLSIRYELKEKEDSIKIQTLEIKNQQVENENISLVNEQRGRLLLIALIGAIVLLSLLSLLYINRKKLKEKNKENELLLGEIHHRVKNNLQVISSILSLHEKSLSDEAAKKAMLEGKERVKSMGLIHKLLYQNENYSGIEMKQYIPTLVEGLLESFGYSKDEFEFKSDLDQIKLDVDSAIPIGLIINELVINALKYAYNKSNKGQLEISLKEKEDELLLMVKDNGSGKVNEVQNSDSFGFKLVNSLIRQINGVTELSDQGGLKYTIHIKDFKLIK